jgi:lipid-binding SYLF domain-containing protein
VFSEIMSAPDKGIPGDLLEKAHCIVIVPDLKDQCFHIRREIREGVLVPS